MCSGTGASKYCLENVELAMKHHTAIHHKLRSHRHGEKPWLISNIASCPHFSTILLAGNLILQGLLLNDWRVGEVTQVLFSRGPGVTITPQHGHRRLQLSRAN